MPGRGGRIHEFAPGRGGVRAPAAPTVPDADMAPSDNSDHDSSRTVESCGDRDTPDSGDDVD